MPAPNQSAWSRRLRRLTYVLGAAGTLYLISTYALDRMKEARIRAVRERREKDTLKSHFSTLLATLSFTLYALLPTLSPQLDAAYPVELTSQALQGLSNPTSSQISSVGAEGESETGAMLESSVPDIPAEVEDGEMRARSLSSGSRPEGSVTESWASEFRGEGGVGPESVMTETDDGLSSATSIPISLPPTDLSVSSGSPPSDMMTSSQLQSSPSPPRHRDASPTGVEALAGKSKKELWRDLKVQSITRAVTTAYLLPLLYVLTTSQLSTLARERYLADVKASLPPAVADPMLTPKGSTGLTSLISESASLLPNPLSLLPDFVISRIPWYSAFTDTAEEDKELSRFTEEERKAAEEIEKADAERMYLTYSWWILHEGWRVVARRVEESVERVIGPMGLKRELTVGNWEALIRDIRREVEYDEDTDRPFDFTPHLLPSFPLPATTSGNACPLPQNPPTQYLARLLSQTRTHLASPDATYLIQGGVSTMVRRLLSSLSDDLYLLRRGDMFGAYHGEDGQDDGRTRRLAECLPAFSRWGKGVWEGVPDVGVETLLGMGEFEGFAGLIFGDWA